jgi:hypothetical protein
LPDDVLRSTRPVLLRGLVSSWPAVEAARQSDRAVVDYLRKFDSKRTATFLTAPPKVKGRFFYNEDLTGFNFTYHHGPLSATLEQILKASSPSAPSIYIGSSLLDVYLPGFRAENVFEQTAELQELASIWIGNRTRIAAHRDLPQNLACVVSGRRRFTLFPPDQLANLYIGPLEFTPAGPSISLVDFHAPDHARFPRFREAMEHALVAEMEPGDALVIPSMWFHHVESLEALNILVNFWWRDEPAFMDSPFNTLRLAMLNIRDLPPEQRRVWQEIFRHYIFEPDEATHGHIPEAARGMLAPMDEKRARDIRSNLVKSFMHQLKR